MKQPARGIERAAAMRRWADKKGGFAAKGDNFDRSQSDTLASLIDRWLERLAERNYSPRSIDMHRWSLKTFLAWAQERDLKNPAQVTRPILESYQRWLYRYRKDDGRPMSVTTQRNRLGAVQRLFAWLCRENHIPANPAADLELPRKEHRQLPKALSPDEIKSLMAVPDIADPLGIRDRAILETLYATGIRRSELVRLDVGDINLARQSLHVRKGKGGKDRILPLGARATQWITRYLDVARPRLEVSVSERALFLSGYGERFNPNYLGNWVARTVKAADIARSGSCHLLRHSCATHMLENGADIRYIQQMLGHARLDTTQIYTEVDIRALAEVHARTHPSGQ